MKLAIMQPYLLPYLGYFQLLHAADRFVIYDDVAFIKQGWINRNRILINGRATYFTVPLRQASSFRLIADTQIDDGPQNHRWRDKMLKTFENAYRRAPCFERVFPLLEDVIRRPAAGMKGMALAGIDVVARYLDIRTARVESSSVYRNAHLSGQDRVLDICRAERAVSYLNPIGGTQLYDREAFARAGLTVKFLKPLSIEYKQFGAPFVPDLSIVDVLMFNPPETARGFLDRYELL
jgi:WbqC-like protein family